MPDWVSYLLPPLIGALIGGVTNDVAIRMLFRPYREWRILGRRVPFTPGLIPRERHQIAGAIAATFVAHVFDGEALGRALLNDDVRARLEQKIAGLIDKLGAMTGLNETMLGMARNMAGGYLLKELDQLLAESGAQRELIEARIRERIDDLDVATLEELVMGFSRKQFRHITWFGVLLGFVIGSVQLVLLLGGVIG